MARRKDLTALAALGTLGYMLSKKGDKKDTASAERRVVADKVTSEEPKSMEDDFGMDAEEAANRRTERMLTNPNAKEYGEAGTSMTVPPSKKPVASPAKPSSGAAKAAPKLINPADIRSGRREFEDSQTAPKLIYPSNIRSGRREFEESQKMASGGMTSKVSSASKRADGIATKGKTRGKIC
jgi:hypothetical protein